MSARYGRYGAWAAIAAVLVMLPLVHRDPYHLHIMVLILIWSFAYTSWSMMGRFGLTSLGHGGFMGVGAYVTALLWNHLGVSPWLGIPIALVCAGLLALVVAYPCFRFRITGHYFALVTLALSGIVLQVITASRDYTGGSLGYTPQATTGSKLIALQSSDKTVWYFVALAVWAVGLLIWFWVDRSMARHAMEAISEDEDAAAAAGVNVTAEKLKITVLSALMTALAGAVYCQYQMFISPDTVSGIAVSLQMVFAAVVGGLYLALGPTVGAVITILLAETLRIGFGTKAVGWDNLIYGALLVAFIIFLPQGILGSIVDRIRPSRRLGGRRGWGDKMRNRSGMPMPSASEASHDVREYEKP
jgi:branched-chain amino acid transport system permease protein